MPKHYANLTTGRADARSAMTTTLNSFPAARVHPEDRWSSLGLPGFPKGVSPTLLLQYEERWVQEEQTPAWAEAMGKIALACAIYRTHHPVLLSWRTGYPFPVIETFLDCLLAEQDWLATENYPRLVLAVRSGREDDWVDKVLAEALEVFGAPSLRRFAAAWERCMERGAGS